jgi:hypothetical protein
MFNTLIYNTLVLINRDKALNRNEKNLFFIPITQRK